MSEINETIAEVLRLDELSEVLSPAPWHVSGVDSQHVRDDADEATADAYCSNDAALIAYYRTAAPALAREVQRLQAEVCEARIGHDCAIMAAYESGLRAGQEAMRVLALAACGAVAAACRQRIEDRYETSAESWEDASAAAAAADCADIIRALEVE